VTAKLIDDCFALDKDRIPHVEALTILKSRIGPVVEIEETSLAEAGSLPRASNYLAAANPCAR
jgi:hypothetical protein